MPSYGAPFTGDMSGTPGDIDLYEIQELTPDGSSVIITFDRPAGAGTPRSNPYAVACSTDGTSGLPAPTGIGLELVITSSGLDDIRYNGTSL